MQTSGILRQGIVSFLAIAFLFPSTAFTEDASVTPEPSASASPTPAPVVDAYDIKIVSRPDIRIQRAVPAATDATATTLLNMNFKSTTSPTGAKSYPPFTAGHMRDFDVLLKPKNGVTQANVRLVVNGLPNCTLTSTSLCLLVVGIGTLDPAGAQNQDANAIFGNGVGSEKSITGITGSNFRSVGRFIVLNPSASSATLNMSAVQAVATNPDDGGTKTGTLASDLTFTSKPLSKCVKVVMSGVKGANNTKSCTSPCAGETTTLLPGNIQLGVDVRNDQGNSLPEDMIQSTTYALLGGGTAPDSSGNWTSPPISPAIDTLIATVTLKDGQQVTCGGPVTQTGLTQHNVQLGPIEECTFHKASEYYTSKATTNGRVPLTKLVGTDGADGVGYPGLFWVDERGNPTIKARYGVHGATSPFRGLKHIGMYIDRSRTPAEIIPFVRDVTGAINVPAPANRVFSAAVLTVHLAARQENETTLPLYYAAIRSTDDLKSPLSLQKVPGVPDAAYADPQRRVTFRLHYAKAEVVKDAAGNYTDKRENDPVQLALFREGDETGFFTTPCSISSPISFPTIKNGDPEMPIELKNLQACIESQVMPLEKVEQGYGKLVAVGSAQIRFNDNYDPVSLAMANTAPCVTEDTTMKRCLVVPKGLAVTTTVSKTSDCHHVEDIPHTSKTPLYDRYGRLVGYNTYNWVEHRDVYTGNCTPIVSDGECGVRMDIRFAREKTNIYADAMCFEAYQKSPALGNADLSGRLIAAVLKDQDVPPHSPTVGGSDPKLYTQYTKGFDNPTAQNIQGFGICSLPCQIENNGYVPRTKAFTDFPSPNYPNPPQRKPEVRIYESQGPAECVDKFTSKVKVKRFGGQCTTGVADEFELCKSENVNINVAVPTCNETRNGKTFTGGDQTFVEASLPFCEGHGPGEFSVSISPLILDVTGKGIYISRTFPRAVMFDIHGKGKRMLMDWPENTKEIAFLALPDKDGKITSMHQLFGDVSAKNGFDALKKYDSKKDGYVDQQDAIFPKLRLWFDRNRNGIAEKGEVEGLAKYGVSRIRLEYNKPAAGNVAGKALSSLYVNTKTGTFMNVEDHYFRLYYADTSKVATNKNGKTKKSGG